MSEPPNDSGKTCSPLPFLRTGFIVMQTMHNMGSGASVLASAIMIKDGPLLGPAPRSFGGTGSP